MWPFSEVLPLVDGSCTTIKVQALRLGHTDLVVRYDREKIKLSAKITIAAYEPLRVSKQLLVFLLLSKFEHQRCIHILCDHDLLSKVVVINR